MGWGGAAWTAAGQLEPTRDTGAEAGIPYSSTLEEDVEDVSRQHSVNRTSLAGHARPWYVRVKRLPRVGEQREGLKAERVAVGLDGAPEPGVKIDVTMTQIQWTSGRRGEGKGFYGWEPERKEVPSAEWHMTSGLDPVALTADL